MISENIFKGERLRLAAVTDADLPVIARWQDDAGYLRLQDARVAYPQDYGGLARWLEEAHRAPNGFVFGIRLLADDQLIGFIELDGILWPHQVGWFGIGIGDRGHWGQGYGAEATRLALAFAFRELNLYRVQLTVFSYNERAIALYEKLGFRREGAFRQFLSRDGQRYDMYLYGLLRPEWEQIVSRSA